MHINFNTDLYNSELKKYQSKMRNASSEDEFDEIFTEYNDYKRRVMERYCDEYTANAKSGLEYTISDLLRYAVYESVSGNSTTEVLTKEAAYNVKEKICEELIPDMILDCEVYENENGWVIDVMFAGNYIPYWDEDEEYVEREENTMSNNEIRTGRATKGEYVIQYQQNGNGGCIPVIDGKPEPSLMFGYTTEADKEACMKVIKDALIATGGDVTEAKYYIMNAVAVSANEITPNDVVEIEGNEYLIDYEKKKIYINEYEVDNLDDLTCELSKEAIKEILVSRVKRTLELTDCE